MSDANGTNNAVGPATSSSTIGKRPVDPSHARSSAVRLTSNTNVAHEPSTSNRRNVASPTEATPLAKSDEHLHRNYNTSVSPSPLPPPEPVVSSAVVRQRNDAEDSPMDTTTAWYKRIAEKYGSVTLENKASVARDHLALERTFLAWLRTSLSFASIGIAITQLFRLNATVPKSGTKQVVTEVGNGPSSSSDLPFSPYIGHAIPTEILPYIHQLPDISPRGEPTLKLGPTLMDQLLGLSADGTSAMFDRVQPSAGLYATDTSDRLKHVGKPLGATFIGISILVLLVGFQRYFEAQHWIIHGKFPASRASISLVTFAALSLVVASLVVIIVVSPDQFER